MRKKLYFICCGKHLLVNNTPQWVECDCGEVMIDFGVSYTRVIGKPNNITITQVMEKCDEVWIDKMNLFSFTTRENNSCFILDKGYYVELRDGYSFFLYSTKGFIGKYAHMKHAFKRYKKEIK